MDHRGHLIDVNDMTEQEMEQKFNEGYRRVPEEYREQSELELMGKKETFVSMKASGTLSKHARYLLKKKLAKEKAERRKKRCHQA